MIHIVIAEDERPLSRGMKILIESLSEFYRVEYCASNGKDALRYMESHRVDILFTDINMPLIDGIELMKIVNEKYPRCKIVVVSGYNDFSYAQSAVHYGVKEYLLKPINKDQLKTILEKFTDEILNDAYNRQKQLLTSILLEGQPTTKTDPFYMAYVVAGFIGRDGDEALIAENQIFRDAHVKSFLFQKYPDVSVFVLERNLRNERCIVAKCESKSQFVRIINDVYAYYLACDVPVTVLYYDESIPMYRLFSKMTTLRNQIKYQICPFTPKLSCYVNEQRKELATNLFGTYLINHILTRLAMHQCTQYEIESAFFKLGNELGFLVSDAKDIFMNLLATSINHESFYASLQQFFMQKGYLTEKDTAGQLMEEVKHYIDANLQEQISLAHVAHKFGIVAPYLSRLFKDKYKKTPSQYIQQQRIETAKQLLKTHPEMLLKDIANHVGYSDPLYFSKIFKKTVGVYPSQYR